MKSSRPSTNIRFNVERPDPEIDEVVEAGAIPTEDRDDDEDRVRDPSEIPWDEPTVDVIDQRRAVIDDPDERDR